MALVRNLTLIALTMGPLLDGLSMPVRASEPAPALQWTRQSAFAIPFVVDRSRGAVAEVHLYVSVDRGANWHPLLREKPEAGRFAFQAMRDGEYWFATRTVDDAGRTLPEGPFKAELVIAVDTVRPQLGFDARVLGPGQIQMAWDVRDEHLAESPLTLEYQTQPDGPWTPIRANLATPESSTTHTRGQLTWNLDSPASSLQVRATATDRAGNRSQGSKKLAVPNGGDRNPGFLAAQSPLVSSGASNLPAATSLPPVSGMAAGTPRSPESGGRGPLNGAPPNSVPPGYAPANTGPAPGALGMNANQDALTKGKPPVDVYRSLGGTSARTTPGTGLAPNAGLSSANGVAPALGSASRSTLADNATSPGAVAFSSRLSSQSSNGNLLSSGDTDNQGFANSGRPVIPGPPLPNSGSALGVRPRMVNDRKFTLDYDVESSGPGGVASVELWVTRNNGNQWARWGVDEDGKSPFEVIVDADGLFGFRVVIVSRSGLASPAPQSGDPADIEVIVDTVAPVGRFESVSIAEGEHAGDVEIRWQAADEHLAALPILLEYAASANGPWTEIDRPLTNSRQYFWNVDAKVPRRVFLRLTVRDEAGNQGVHTLSKPISLAGLTPAARIKNLSTLPSLPPQAPPASLRDEESTAERPSKPSGASL